MPDLWWLLLPVAAASGWWAARRREQRVRQVGSPEFNAEYFRGLNFLLNEQPDKAIEVFIRMLEVNSETVETHLALGNLFRRRGEVDRAIRIHQNLIARPSLSHSQRNDALLELSEDYMRAGLLDRAEGLLCELIDKKVHTVPSLRHLLDIYQQEKDWDKAIDVARRLDSATGQAMHTLIAQFYCELAQDAWRRGSVAKAQDMLKRALSNDRRCVRASILQGDIALDAGEYQTAITCFRQVETQDIEFLPEVLERLRICYEAIDGESQLVDFFRGVAEKYRGVSVTLALADLIRKRDDAAAATRFIAEQLRRRPSVRGLERLIELNLARSEGVAKDNLMVLKDLFNQLLENKAVYKCIRCGFAGRELHWQCPTCKTWNSVKPIHGVEGE